MGFFDDLFSNPIKGALVGSGLGIGGATAGAILGANQSGGNGPGGSTAKVNPFGLTQAEVNAYSQSGSADGDALKRLNDSLTNPVGGPQGALLEDAVKKLKGWTAQNAAAVQAHQTYLDASAAQPGRAGTILTPMNSTKGDQSTILGTPGATPKTVLG